MIVLSIMARQKLLPSPPIGLDANTAVLRHQSQACAKESDAQVLIVGDSTCLVGVDALELSRELRGHIPVLSLALFIWMDLEVYAEEVAEFATTHPGQVRAIVLLVTPAKLSGGAGLNPSTHRLWLGIHEGKQFNEDYLETRNQQWLGTSFIRRNLLSHALATPLHDSGARFYGFASEVEAYMTEHKGSLVSPGEAPPIRVSTKGRSSKIALGAATEAESKAFRAKLPDAIRLYIGLTPGPANAPVPSDLEQRVELLRQWNQWMHADALLTNLPPTLPTVFFSGGGHLNELGQKRFTSALARELSPLLEDAAPESLRK